MAVRRRELEPCGRTVGSIEYPFAVIWLEGCEGWGWLRAGAAGARGRGQDANAGDSREQFVEQWRHYDLLQWA